jgi:predicted DNA-binding ribbon-helix-helix protein
MRRPIAVQQYYIECALYDTMNACRRVSMQLPELRACQGGKLPMPEHDDTYRSAPDTSQAVSDDISLKRVARSVGDGHLKSRVMKRSLVVGGHKTSVSLEDVFWNELRWIAGNRHLHLSQLVGSIDADRQHCNLSSAIRLFVFQNTTPHPAQSTQRTAGQTVKQTAE